jgi:murein DD-endopeptidase MepM/ murein hydrolase activator NlpD
MLGVTWRLPRVATALALLALVLASTTPAFSIDEEEVERARQEAEAAALERAAALEDLDAAVGAYEAINSELQELTFRIGRLRGQLDVYEDRTLEMRDQIRYRAVESYMNGDTRDPVAQLFSPEEVQQSIIAREVLAIAVESDAAALDTLVAATAEMERLRSSLDADTARVAELRFAAEAVVARMNVLFESADETFAAAEKVLEGAEAELAEQQRREAEEQRRRDEVRAALGAPPLGVPMWVTPGFICPIAGPTWFLDTWGAPRSGGTRTHKGTDMFSPLGTPLVAVGDGTVRKSYDVLGGYILWLYADHGVNYFYAHLDSYAGGLSSGQRVSHGQVIGYVGDTGNPPPGAYHLHFGIYPGGITAVNPYPTVAATCG